MAKLAVPFLVMAMGAALLAVVLVNLAKSAQPDYADLDPAPNSIVWQEGHETTLWLETNRNWVDMRIGSVTLGLGDIRRTFPESGGTLDLGRGEGCLDWAVSSLSVVSIGDAAVGKTIIIEGTVDRNGFGGQLTVNIRVYPAGTAPRFPLTATVAASSSLFNHTRDVAPADTNMWVIEASKDDKFPQATTRAITVPIDDLATAITIKDEEAENIRVLRDRGIGIIACGAVDDVVVSLHGDNGEELNRYLVDVHPASTPVPTASNPAYISRRVCVDAADAQNNYLSGGELVGAVIPRSVFRGVTSSATIVLSDTSPENRFKFFFSYSTTGSIQLSVTDVGASELGLDADRVYAVRLTATDVGSGTAEDPDDTAFIDVGVWLDMSTLSPTGNGQCS